MIRVCPKRDAVCPHGMECPYVVDRYTCKEERTHTMIIRIEKVENGWTIETIYSPEIPTRTVEVARTRGELMTLLETAIPHDLKGTPL